MNEEWLNESDEKSFLYKGYRCEILRHSSLGHLCGYVYCETNEKDYHEYPFSEISCHGGLTFSDENMIGFDCAHLGDFVPGMGTASLGKETYKNMLYVENELKKVADQLIKLKIKKTNSDGHPS